jgi:hypothetical protein
MSDLEPHPRIVSVRLRKDDESGEPEYVVTTDLNINPESPAFDKRAFDELRNHVEKWQRERVVRATIQGPV